MSSQMTEITRRFDQPVHEETFKLASDAGYPENFPRNAKWCPDGSVFLAQAENRTFQIIDRTTGNLTPDGGGARTILRQPAPILDYLWYPMASRLNPAAYCFVASLRASYSIVDHRERHIAPHSLSFNAIATKLYCGFEDAIEVFDVHRPGQGDRIATSPAKKSKDGLKGIISALAFCPSYDSDLFAAGSLSPASALNSNIALFSADTGHALMFVGTDTTEGTSHPSVTQLRFNPTQPHILYGAFRKRDAIYSWDLRGHVSAPVAVFRRSRPATTTRPPATNQKLLFDVDPSGQWLSVGDEAGSISTFSLTGAPMSTDEATVDDAQEVPPASVFSAHNDAIGSVAFHPWEPMLLSASGSRHFSTGLSSAVGAASDSDESSDDESSNTSAEHQTGRSSFVRRRRSKPTPHTKDASLKLWRYGPVGGNVPEELIEPAREGVVQ
ncbi:hypothetical protein PUNSTDRAFT_146018 [Punctularia strigosozonata HHB-11173 SS5]|uniref:WD40 repeat-like protein n=1 Tax=Punctularia strigosozonata (strain HHB-11173) TaxID=741275 RepID=R7S4E0_PUNST|nr:uncharacterized protein PUNSTDRAFT_146018 [Punctularia strigosozonata HHB-11173 SS5]EIN05098.1 hypothetical protein PUNSTDRAFT_146018 [Punctularia strigosozonata HHB-11173 SS5]